VIKTFLTESDLLVLKMTRKLNKPKPNNTFRGRPEFGMRIYRILTSGENGKE
jgi:hypothetical protein